MPRISVDAAALDAPAARAGIVRAVDWLRAGGIVILPTDTLYGVAVDPSSPRAVQAVFDLKGRAADAALPLIAASLTQVEAWAGPFGDDAARLARAFWPGPLSLVLGAPASVCAHVHAGTHTVAVRVPAHAVARALCAAWGGPLTATSANRSGAPPGRRVAEVGPLADDPRVLVLDAGDAPGGPPSTIVDARVRPPVCVRAGAVAWDRVLKLLQE